MRVTATTDSPAATAADTVAVGVFDGEDVAHDVSDGLLQALLDSGEAKRRLRALAVAHADGKRWIVVGLGDRERFDAERARLAAAAAHGRARELSAKALCWEVPHHVGEDVVAGLVEGTMLSAYRHDRFKSSRGDDDGAGGGVEELLVSAHHDVAEAAGRAAVAAAAVNRARDLQNAPPNHMTPTDLARRAEELAREHPALHVDVEGREAIEGRGMGAFAAVARGSDEPPALITIRYGEPPFALGVVGKAVTFDTGGISLKPAARMHEMKFDMSGGAAALEAMGAIAALELPLGVVAVVGATENMPSGHAVKPSDVVTAMNGTTIEVNNTDAEGRLVLADCLARCVELRAERIVDLATLTGAVLTALGTTYAGLMSNDDAWAEQVAGAGAAAGDPVWRLPLHDEYAELIKGRTADIVNAVEPRRAGTIVGAEFLKRFVGDTPWAHVDIAGTASDTGKPYAPKGGTGAGVRLIVELARRLATR